MSRVVTTQNSFVTISIIKLSMLTRFAGKSKKKLVFCTIIILQRLIREQLIFKSKILIFCIFIQKVQNFYVLPLDLASAAV